jgi:multidrug resistance protein, MATE family
MKQNLSTEIKTLSFLAAPIVLGQISQMLFGFIDTLMIGHLGTIELAASSFGNSVYVIFLVFGIGLGNATTPLISRAIGRTDHAGARRILHDAIIVNVVTGFILTIACFVTGLFFDNMGQTEQVAHQGRTFFLIMAVTLIPSMLYQCYKQYLECILRPHIPMYAAFGGLALNVALNLVLIFGAGPIPAFGVAGAASGTLIARLLMLAFLAGYVRWETSHRAPELTQQMFEVPARKDVMGELLRLGIPTAFILLFEVGAFATATVMMGWIGPTEQAAHQVTLSLVSLTFMVPLGLGFASSIRVGTEIGRGNYHAAKRAGTASLWLAAIFMAAMALLFGVGRNYWPLLFSTDAKVIEIASYLLVVGAVFQVSDGVQVVAVGLLRALKDVRWPFAITLIAYWIFGLPVGYILAIYLDWGPAGLWWGLASGLTFAAVALTTRFYDLLKVHTRTSE